MNLDLLLNDQLLATFPLAAAAAVCKLDAHEVEWAIEEHGRCDVLGELVLVAPGTVKGQQGRRIRGCAGEIDEPVGVGNVGHSGGLLVEWLERVLEAAAQVLVLGGEL